MKNPSAKPRTNPGLFLPLLVLLLTGCDMLGKGTQEALYTLPEKSRVLVLVEPRSTSGMPPDVSAKLGDLIIAHLYKYNVADQFVSQARITELRKDPNFNGTDPQHRMGLADMAALTNADVVLYIDILRFDIEDLSGGQVVQGNAVAMVKVVSKNGKRLWPSETYPLGQQVNATVPPTLNEQGGNGAVQAKLMHDLAINVGRQFHAYDKEDKELNPHQLGTSGGM